MTQYSEIKSVCDELHQAGTPITLETLLTRVNGDKATVLAHYRQWRSEDRSVEPTNTQHTSVQSTHSTQSVEVGDMEFSEQFIQAFKAQTQTYADAQLAPVQAQLESALNAEKLALESISALEQTEQQSQQRISELDEQLQARQSQLDEQQQTISWHEQQLETVKQQSESIKQEAEQKAASLQQKIDTFDQEFAAVANERDQAQLQHEQLANQHTQLEGEHQQLQASLQRKDEQLAEQQPLVDKLKNENNLLKEQSAVAAKHQESQREDIKLLREQTQAQTEKLQQSQQEKAQFEDEAQKLQEQVRFLKNNSASTIERLTASNEQYQQKFKELEDQLVAKDNAAQATLEENKRLKEQITFLKQNSTSTLERLAKNAEMAQSRLGDLESSLAETHAELERLRSDEDMTTTSVDAIQRA